MDNQEYIPITRDIVVTEAMIEAGVRAYREHGQCEVECDGLDHSLVSEVILAALREAVPCEK